MKTISQLVFCGVVLIAAQVNAQPQTNRVVFQNSMGSPIDVTITPVGGGTPQRFTVSENQSIPFNFTDAIVSLQAVPRDEPNSGYPADRLDLADLARRFPNQPIIIDGERKDSTTKTVCCRRGLFRRRCCCYTVTVPGERIAMLIQAGNELLMRVPKAGY